jgi:hypothetical protein
MQRIEVVTVSLLAKFGVKIDVATLDRSRKNYCWTQRRELYAVL